MKFSAINTLMPLIMLLLLTGCRDKNNNKVAGTDNRLISGIAYSFDLKNIRLLNGPFKSATELNLNTLLSLEPDKLLAKFRSEAGLMPKAEHYHGLEDHTIAAHSMGHYLSACALMYQATGNNQLLERVNYIIDELDSCQVADSTDYIGAIPGGKSMFTEVAKVSIRSSDFYLNDIQTPFYTGYKIMAGLRDAFRLCGIQKALETEKKFAYWLATIVMHLPDSSMQKILQCEHGGIIEVMADLYGDTGEDKYLLLSKKFHCQSVFDSLMHGVDVLPGEHVNTQMAGIIGLARHYELTGDSADRKTAEFFWKQVVKHHSYVTGGQGNNGYFGRTGRLRNRLGPLTSDMCSSYNMMKLTSHIFSWTTSAQAADFYERVLFNHILASQHPADGRIAEYLSLDMGGFKEYQPPYSFTCGAGTSLEIHSKHSGAIYYHNDEEIFINQFIASELTWKEKGVVLKQQTKYPEEQGTSIRLNLIRPADLTFCIRYPYWAKNGITIKINGKTQEVSETPGSFVRLKRTWKNNDQVEVAIPFTLRLESMPDDRNRIAVMYGPLVLAGDLGPEGDLNMSDQLYVPVFVTTDRDPANYTEPVQGRVNEFLTKGVGKPRDVLLKPFYLTHERTYSVYWDLFSAKQWENLENDYNALQARKKWLETITHDFITAGDSVAEQKHKLKSEHSHAGHYKMRPYRKSYNGWFSYEIKVPPKRPTAIIVEYLGTFPGSGKFDIVVGNSVIASEEISYGNKKVFFENQYVIPEVLTHGKKKITVTFRAHENQIVGPLFSIRLIEI
ncbi:MAG: glycoside hydrolase family 127 protein [Bacteroidales bacterium]|nr:glycoside hydrolase family 127 protein [Bacteroidales bacterium]